MNPLCVFVCDNQDIFDRVNVSTKEAEYHRFFILSSNKIIRNNLSHKSSDNFMIYDFDLSSIDIIARLVTCYSHPMYSHIYLFKNENVNIENQKLNFRNHEFFQNEDCLGFTRQYVALNGFNFQPVNNKIIYDPIKFASEINKALNEEPVEQIFFIEALKELLPDCEYVGFENLENLEDDIKNILRSKSKKLNSKYNVLYEPNFQNYKDTIVFTKINFDSYKFAIRRVDGFNCYIL